MRRGSLVEKAGTFCGAGYACEGGEEFVIAEGINMIDCCCVPDDGLIAEGKLQGIPRPTPYKATGRSENVG